MSMRQSQKPLAANKVAKSTDNTSPSSLSAFGTNLAPPPLPSTPQLPGLNPSLSSAMQTSQNQANKANQTRYGQGLGVLTGGQNTAQSDIQAAMASNVGYGDAARTRLSQQLQSSLGQQTQSAVSRGLSDTTVADTMKDLPQRQYNDAMANVTEQQANRMSGLQLDAANSATQGAGTISGYIASRNDKGPDVSTYAGLASNAANRPASIQGSMGSPNAPNPAPKPTGGGSSTPAGNGGYFSMGGDTNGAGGGSGTLPWQDSNFGGGASGNVSSGGDFGSGSGGGGGSISGAMNYSPDDPGFG